MALKYFNLDPAMKKDWSDANQAEVNYARHELQKVVSQVLGNGWSNDVLRGIASGILSNTGQGSKPQGSKKSDSIWDGE